MTFETRSEGMEGVRNAELQVGVVAAKREFAALRARRLAQLDGARGDLP